MKNKGDKTMKKVLLTSAVALAAFGAVQAVSADNVVLKPGMVDPATGKLVTAPVGQPAQGNNPETFDAKNYRPAKPANEKPATAPLGSNDNGYGTPSHTQGTVTVTIIDLSTGKPVSGATVDFNAGGKVSSVTTDANGVAKLADVKPGVDVAYRLNVPAGYAEDSYNGHVTAVAGNVPATFSIRPATVTNDRDGIHPAKPAPAEFKAVWVKNDKGQWTYVKDAQGTKATGWLKDNGTWYYLDKDGIMQTGWVKDNGTWYYLDGSGAMQKGWKYVGGHWYYLDGAGAMQTGWKYVSGHWYYLNASGALLVNTTTPDGYTVNGSGELV